MPRPWRSLAVFLTLAAYLLAGLPEGLLEGEECECHQTRSRQDTAGAVVNDLTRPGAADSLRVTSPPDPSQPLPSSSSDGCCCFCMAKAPSCLGLKPPPRATLCLGPSL